MERYYDEFLEAWFVYNEVFKTWYKTDDGINFYEIGETL